MITVACVKWGRKYDSTWVLKLRSMVARNLSVPHKFVCFTEIPVEGVECRPLPSDLPTWWSKVGLFRPGLFDGDVLYLDLDVVICEPIDGMVALLEQDRTGLWIRDDFSYSLRIPRGGIGPDAQRTLGGVGCCNSSVMMWHGDTCREVWEKFDRRCMDVLHGDQNWISQLLYPAGKIRFLPDEWASSYKYGGSGVIKVFHGTPKPSEVADRWVQECWR